MVHLLTGQENEFQWNTDESPLSEEKQEIQKLDRLKQAILEDEEAIHKALLKIQKEEGG